MGVQLIADWIPHMKTYRLYDPEHPEQAIAYVDDPKEAEDRGYKVLINKEAEEKGIMDNDDIYTVNIKEFKKLLEEYIDPFEIDGALAALIDAAHMGV